MINLELIKTAQLYRKHCAGLSAIGELFMFSNTGQRR